MALVAHLNAVLNRIAEEVRQCVRPEHPGLARAWVCGGTVDGETQRWAGHGVSDLQRLSKGRYRVVFDPPLPDAHYAWVASGRPDAASSTIRVLAARQVDAKTPYALELMLTTGNNRPADALELNVVVFR